MKKFAIIALLAIVTTASATDFGIRAGRNTSGGLDNAGVVVDQKFGSFGAEASFDRTAVKRSTENKVGLLGTYDVATVFGTTVTAKAGGVITEPKSAKAGASVVAGVGLSYPVAKNVSVVADYAYQFDKSRVSAFNGNTVSAGIKYSF